MPANEFCFLAAERARSFRSLLHVRAPHVSPLWRWAVPGENGSQLIPGSGAVACFGCCSRTERGARPSQNRAGAGWGTIHLMMSQRTNEGLVP